MVLQRFKSDGSLESTHTVTGVGKLASKHYFVMGDGQPGAAPIDYSYSPEDDNLGEFTAGVGGLALLCQGREIDRIMYGTDGGLAKPTEGRSLSFDGGVAPDGFLNDRVDWWCSAGDYFDGFNIGTPGAANVLCGFATCDDAGVARDVVAPGVGDLFVSEVMANPSGTDDGKEWLEVYVASDSALDLNGLSITTSSASGTSPKTAQVSAAECVRVEPHTYVVIAAASDPAVNGHVAADAVAPGLEFSASGAKIVLAHGRATIDEALIGDATDGKSASLDPLKFDGTQNDAAEAFCTASTTGMFDGAGTPGATNDLCGDGCYDVGVPRATVPPNAGGLVVTEVYPDPTGTDNAREWVELYVAQGPVDLNGVKLISTASSATTKTITSGTCLRVEQGTFVVVGGENVSLDQVTASAIISGFSLPNSSTVTQASIDVKVGELLVDSMIYPLPAIQGKSYALTTAVLDATGNNNATNWCWSSVVHAPFTGTGSPGVANDTCP